MTPLPDLVALLYRADWTQLCLSARVTSRRDRAVDGQLRRRVAAQLTEVLGTGPYIRWPAGSEPESGWQESERRVLLAPGGRYRITQGADDGRITICDGEFCWEIYEGIAHRCPWKGPGSALHGLVTPQWLIAYYNLEITGETAIGRRSAHQVSASQRAVCFPLDGGNYHLLDGVRATVDAELGILLSSEQLFGGQTLELAELDEVIIDPAEAGDPAMFAPPAGLPVEDDWELGPFEPQGRGWQAASTAAGLAASAMGFAVRHAPRREPARTPGDAESAMPADAESGPASRAAPGASSGAAPDAAPGASPGGGQPLSDELVNLLHRTGRPAQDFTAELHQWVDEEAVVRGVQAIRPLLPLAGMLGPDALWDALRARGQKAGSGHKTARLSVGVPGRYRIDYLTGDWGKKYKAIACDGEHTRKLYDDRVATGPAGPIQKELAGLVDPAWLLSTWKLAAAGEVSVAGRRGVRIVAEAPGGIARSGPNPLFSPMEIIVDAELGIVLRQTSYAGLRPAMREELRDLTSHAGDAAADFRMEDVWGLRSVRDGGGLLGDRNLPAPVQAAGTVAALAAGGAIAGAVAVTGWLDKLRARRG